MGCVWKGKYNGEVVAIKDLIRQDKDTIAIALKEAQFLFKLCKSHPENIV